MDYNLCMCLFVNWVYIDTCIWTLVDSNIMVYLFTYIFCNFSVQFWNTIEFQFHFYSHRLFFVVIQDVKAENHCPVLHRTHCLLILHDITLNIKIFYIQSLKSYLGMYDDTSTHLYCLWKSIQDLRKLKYIISAGKIVMLFL